MQTSINTIAFNVINQSYLDLKYMVRNSQDLHYSVVIQIQYTNIGWVNLFIHIFTHLWLVLSSFMKILNKKV